MLNRPFASRLFTYYIPVLFFAFVCALDTRFPEWGITGSEMGLVENLQAAILLVAFIIGARLLVKYWRISPPWLRVWLVLATIGALYVCLEETSYGQQYFHWQTPAEWAQINDQHETNLHNTSSWFDQKPRLVLEIGIIVGGLIVPLLRRFKPAALPKRFALILPPTPLFLVALLAEAAHLHQGVIYYMHHREWHLFERSSEMQEIYFYYFVLLYLIVLGQRLKTYRGAHVAVPD